MEKWDEVPTTAVLLEGQVEKEIYPLAVSVDGCLMLSEKYPPSEQVRGRWKDAHLISWNKAVDIIEVCNGRAIFKV